MSAGLGFVLAVVALAAVAIAIALRILGFSWREVLQLVGGAIVGAAFLWALVILGAALAAPGPVR